MSGYILINLGTLVLFGLGYLLDLINFPYLKNIIGLVFILFLPGFNLTYLIFNKEKEVNSLERLLFSVTFSITLLPLLIYISYLFLGLKITEFNILIQGIGLTFIVFLIVLVRQGLSRKTLPVFKLRFPQPLSWGFLVYFVIFGTIFFLYKFLPEADSYIWLVLIGKIIKTGTFPPYYDLTYRPFFSLWVASLFFFSHVDPYWLFKFILPLFLFLYLIPFYLFATKITQNRYILFLTTLIPLTIPVIVMETEVIRPQSIIILFLPVFLYFLSRAISEKSYKIWLVNFIASIFTLEFHELSFFLLFISVASFFVLAWEDLKKNPKRNFFIGLALFFALYPYLRDFGIFQGIFSWFRFGFSFLKNLKFRPWFISNYVDISGNQMGWPGIQAFYYYAYNLGVLIPLILISCLFVAEKIKKRKVDKGFSFFPSVFSLAIFFFIAEILPRFNLHLLSDRAWPFLIFSLAFVCPLILEKMKNLFSQTWFKILIVLAIFVSLGGSFYIAYAKQGRISDNEYKAFSYIQNFTPENAIVISQAGNQGLIEYFAKRYCFNVDIFSPGIPLEEILGKLKDMPEIISQKNELEAEKSKIIKELKEQQEQISQSRNLEQIENYKKQLFENIRTLSEINKKLERIEKEGLDQSRPIYILYSFDKFKNLNILREWWRESNYYVADLSKFDNEKYFEKIFDNQAVKIWHYKGE